MLGERMYVVLSQSMMTLFGLSKNRFIGCHSIKMQKNKKQKQRREYVTNNIYNVLRG